MMRRLALALVAAALLGALPARASQGSIVQPISGPHTMEDLNNNYLNPALLALISQSSGSSAPTNGPSSAPVAYQLWADTSASPTTIRIYDGSVWNAVFTVNPSTHAIALATNVEQQITQLGTLGGLTMQGIEQVTALGSPTTLTINTSPPTSGQGIWSSGSGAYLRNCDIVGCTAAANTGMMQYRLMTSLQNVTISEYAMQLDLLSSTGIAPQWNNNSTFAAGTYVHSYASGYDLIYYSASGGVTGIYAPACTSGTCSDGAITWTFIGPGINDGKVNQALSTIAGPNAGHTWNSAFDLIIDQYAYYGAFWANLELDAGFAPGASGQNCVVGGCNGYNLFLYGDTYGTLTAAIRISTAQQASVKSYHYAVLILETVLADTADILVSDDAPDGVLVGGTRSDAGFKDQSTAYAALIIAGSYSGFQIAGENGFAVGLDGSVYLGGAGLHAPNGAVGATCGSLANASSTDGVVTGCGS